MMAEDEPIHPGKQLKAAFLDPLGITPSDLATAIGVPVERIRALIRGERTLTPDTAGRLGLYFRVPALWFLEAQARFEAAAVEQNEGLSRVVVPFPGLDEVIVTPKGVVRVRRVEKSKPMSPWMASASHKSVAEGEGTRVVHYPNGMVALEHR
jgi:addiction module HigA family antidote